MASPGARPVPGLCPRPGAGSRSRCRSTDREPSPRRIDHRRPWQASYRRCSSGRGAASADRSPVLWLLRPSWHKCSTSGLRGVVGRRRRQRGERGSDARPTDREPTHPVSRVGRSTDGARASRCSAMGPRRYARLTWARGSPVVLCGDGRGLIPASRASADRTCTGGIRQPARRRSATSAPSRPPRRCRCGRARSAGHPSP